jgi:hypothetical protein
LCSPTSALDPELVGDVLAIMRKLAAWRSGVVAASGWPGVPPPIRSIGRPGGWRVRPSHRWEAKSADNWQRVHGLSHCPSHDRRGDPSCGGAAWRRLLTGLLAPPKGYSIPIYTAIAVNGSLSFLARWLDRRGRRYGRTVQPSTADEAA